MKKIFLFLLPTFLFSCIWIDGTTIDGEHKYVSYHSSMLEQSVHRFSSQTKLDDILKADKRESYSKEDKKEHNAVVSLLKGDYNLAIEQLLEIEKLHPNQYSIASNLGTAYELNGENEKALAWITKGIKRDVNSHYGTEWLHQYILELKIKLAENPNFLQTSRAIPIEGKFNLQSKIAFDNTIYTIEEIRRNKKSSLLSITRTYHIC
jgi:tetratricopeptide (TPR) repeat protein